MRDASLSQATVYLLKQHALYQETLLPSDTCVPHTLPHTHTPHTLPHAHTYRIRFRMRYIIALLSSTSHVLTRAEIHTHLKT
jgi:hypothetical protein